MVWQTTSVTPKPSAKIFHLSAASKEGTPLSVRSARFRIQILSSRAKKSELSSEASNSRGVSKVTRMSGFPRELLAPPTSSRTATMFYYLYLSLVPPLFPPLFTEVTIPPTTEQDVNQCSIVGSRHQRQRRVASNKTISKTGMTVVVPDSRFIIKPVKTSNQRNQQEMISIVINK